MAKKPVKKNSPAKQNNLAYERKNGYDRISAEDLKKMDKICAEYMEYLGASKTEREAHDQAVKLLKKAGYVDFDELVKKNAKIKPGTKFYRSCAGKTLMAVHMGKQKLEKGMRLIGGHTDAPRLDIKQNPMYEADGLAYLDTHYYGGIKKYQWVSMPLALHGVFVKEDGKKINVVIGEDESDPVLFISDLLPHLGASQSQKPLGSAIEGDQLDVCIGSTPVKDEKAKNRIKTAALEILNKKYGIKEEDFLSAELEIVPAGKPRYAGFDRSLLLGYGHDDRICSYAGLKALVDLKAVPEYSACVLLCDKEEIGSYGATGMQGNFFENTVSEMINLENGRDSELLAKRCMAVSKMLSADVNAAVDPLYPGVHEFKNAAYINQGVCISKFTGARGKSGSNDANAEFLAEVRAIFNKAGVLWQTAELGKVDVGGGGTIAWMMARYGMDVVDCGTALLSMHAPWEAASTLDTYMTYKSYYAFLAAK